MQELAWTPFDPDWKALPDKQRQEWRSEQVEIYDTYTARNLIRATPADFGRYVRTDWIDLEHILFISDMIAKFVRGELIAANGKPARRLFLTMPPRHGKSFLLSQIVPAWYLTLFPNRHVILTTYEADFAASWGGKVRDIIDQHGGAFGLSLAPDSKSKSRFGLAKPYLGGMITAGMGGPITGMGGGLLIGDDWVKNAQEANSQNWRDGAWDWYNTTFKTRFQKDLSDPSAPPPLMLLLMTRWHEDDPPGRLIQRQGADTIIIHLPALAGDNDPLGRAPGEALCPAIMSAEELLELKAEDPRSFEALYQGNPTLEEGGLFSRSKFRYWKQGGGESGAYWVMTPEGAYIPYQVKECKHFITTDLAISKKTSADFTVFCLWALTPDRDLLLVSRFRDRIEEAQHLQELQRFHDEAEKTIGSRPLLVGIEKQTYGLSLIANSKRGSNMTIRPLDIDQDKYSRAVPAGEQVRNGKVYLPDHVDWAEEFISECTAFDNGTHDDQVDCLSYAVEVANTTFRHVGRRKIQEPVLETADNLIERHVQSIAERNRAVRKKNQRRWV